MKYDLQVTIEPKDPKQALNLNLPVPVLRDFKWVVKHTGQSMTHVVTRLLEEFVTEHRNIANPKQRKMF